MIEVSVAYGDGQKVFYQKLSLAHGVTVKEVVEASGVMTLYDEINPNETKVGIFGEVVSWSSPVNQGDRVEIYRPLLVCPKEARKRRAQKEDK